MGVEPDNEAKEIWYKYLPKERVLPFGMKGLRDIPRLFFFLFLFSSRKKQNKKNADNFWEMGATGPCGPCTEIHYDRIGGRDASHLVNADVAEVIEIWNNVFIQFNRESQTKLVSLPHKHVDTGMGFERLTSILQNVPSNYDTDIFTPIMEAIQKVTECKESYAGKVGKDDFDGKDMAYRVVSDHIRTLTFAIRDGAQPDATGRNYVLRRILRRAVRYGTEKLGAKPGFFHKLVDVVVEQFGDFFTELKDVEKMRNVENIIKEEEVMFNRTLKFGTKLFTEKMAELERANAKVFPGDEIFKLYATYGFPADLTELMAKEKGIECDMKVFSECMEEAKIISAKKEEGTVFSFGDLEKTQLNTEGVPSTNDEPKYEWRDIKTKLLAIASEKGGVDLKEVTSKLKR